jgi:hypothetical protein
VSSAWREDLLTRAEELHGLASWIHLHGDRADPLLKEIDAHLLIVRQTAGAGPNDTRWERWVKRRWRGMTGASFERSLGNLDAAEVHLFRLAPPSVLIPALPSIEATVNRYLPKDDPRRQAVDRIAAQRREKDDGQLLTDSDRDNLISAQHAANSQRRRDLIRLRTFRNLLWGGVLVFLAIAVVLGVIGSKSPTTIPLCFTPESDGMVTVVCPRQETPVGEVAPGSDLDPEIANTVSTDDVWLVELLGLLGAALTGAAALRNLASNSTPYAVPVTLALFKLPTGAVTAVIGLVLMRADFVPGLSALDTSAQILGWAVVFGIAQQLVTQFADSQASGLLDNIKGRGAGGDRELKG